MIRRPYLVIILTSLIVGLGVVSLTPQFGQFLSRFFFPKKVSLLEPEIAQYSHIKGKVWQRHHGRGTSSRLRAQGPIYHRDQLVVEPHASMQLSLASGNELNIREKSKVVIEYWNAADPKSPVYLTFLMGDFELLKEGTKGSLYIVKDRRLFSPSFRPPTHPYSLTLENKVIGIAPEKRNETEIKTADPEESSKESESEFESDSAKASLSDSSASLENTPSEKSPTPTKSVLPGKKPETLSNSYIESVMTNQRYQFQKCQANAIRTSGPIKGQVLIGFTIVPSGKIEETKILQSDIENQQLLDCLLSVIRATPFDEFTGAPIVRSYPLTFE